MALDPSTLGRYRILGELGRGAMGVVYLAEDPLLKRPVAVKVVTGAAGSREDALARFHREAEMAARLHHPGIVTIHDVGEEPGIGPFLAMEYVKGRSLQERIRSGPIPVGEAADLIAQAVAAVEAAHALGILHRDIKPGNFMLSEEGRLKLMDFGLALVNQPATTALMCTPSFAAPELLAGGGPSTATDTWALVVTAWEVLTGRLPFDRSNVAAVLTAITSEAPNLEGPVSWEVREVFNRALDKAPAVRFPTPRAFLTALLAVLPLEDAERLRLCGTGATETITLTPMRRPWMPGWLGKALLAGLGVLVVVGLGRAWLAGSLGTRRLTVLSQPRGAMVVVDGRVLGETPLVDSAIPPFAHELRLEQEGHQPLVRALTRSDRRLDLRLVPAPVKVNLESTPEGAEVLLDGRAVGTTPLKELELPAHGKALLEVELKGYERWSMTVSRSRRPPERIVLRKLEGAPRKKKGLMDTVKGWFN